MPAVLLPLLWSLIFLHLGKISTSESFSERLWVFTVCSRRVTYGPHPWPIPVRQSITQTILPTCFETTLFVFLKDWYGTQERKICMARTSRAAPISVLIKLDLSHPSLGHHGENINADLTNSCPTLFHTQSPNPHAYGLFKVWIRSSGTGKWVQATE